MNAAKGTPAQLKEAADDLRQKFSTIVTAGLQVVAQANDPAVRADVISNTTAVFTSVSRLLQACKALNTDPTAPNLRNLLPVATKAVNEALQKLVSVGSAAAPGQKECDQANQILDQALSRLEAVNDPNADNEGAWARPERHPWLQPREFVWRGLTLEPRPGRRRSCAPP